MLSSVDDLTFCKKIAAERAIQEREFKGNMVIGIGSGSTIVFAITLIAERIKNINKEATGEEKISDLNVVCIPSSFQAKQLIIENNLNLGSLDAYPVVNWTIDGADEFDENNNIIKGGGGCLTQEKILASSSKNFYVIADKTKFSPKLGTNWKKGIPIEVISGAHISVKRKIECELGGTVILRLAVAKAGPVVTDNGHFILDWKFPDNIKDWKSTETLIKMIPGVIEIGLFINMATKIYTGFEDGEVKTFTFSND